jgi:hypothetical protein
LRVAGTTSVEAPADLSDAMIKFGKGIGSDLVTELIAGIRFFADGEKVITGDGVGVGVGLAEGVGVGAGVGFTVGTGGTNFAIGTPLPHISFDPDFWHVNLTLPTTNIVPTFLHAVPVSDAPANEILPDKRASNNATSAPDFFIS